ncbi:MAG TPA: ABC transporter substrate-binding protein [Thermaerobacter sp.]
MPRPDRPAMSLARGAGGSAARTPGLPDGRRRAGRRPAGALLLGLLLLAAGGAGWWQAGARGPGPGGPGAPRRWIRDDHGQWVAAPAVPRRVACLTAELCAVLRELLPAGAVVPVEPGDDEVERLRAVAPDLVLLPEVTRTPGLARRLRAAGLAGVTVRMRRVTELPDAAARVGEWLGRPARGRALAAAYGARLERVAARTRDLQAAARPPVLVLAWKDPPVVAGPASPVAELVALAGGRLVPASPGGAAWMAGEAVARGTGVPAGTRIVTPLLQPGPWPLRGGGPRGPATLHYLPPGQLLGAGPEALTGLERLAAWLHPRRFPGLRAEPPIRLGPGGAP